MASGERGYIVSAPALDWVRSSHYRRWQATQVAEDGQRQEDGRGETPYLFEATRVLRSNVGSQAPRQSVAVVLLRNPDVHGGVHVHASVPQSDE